MEHEEQQIGDSVTHSEAGTLSPSAEAGLPDTVFGRGSGEDCYLHALFENRCTWLYSQGSFIIALNFCKITRLYDISIQQTVLESHIVSLIFKEMCLYWKDFDKD